jgi:ubiquinone/menaquinone biosynthesis C-methylase UbiE
VNKDLFSGHADLYAKYRPLYPQELYDFVLKFIPEKNKALDCGTGNGQAAGVLADHFKEVHATDISQDQLARGIQKPNLIYHLTPAEVLPFQDNEFDLITVATALHWFQFQEFFAEVNRVGKNNGVFAAWAYSVVKTEDHFINQQVDRFYYQTIHSYWDPERIHVDEQYKNIPFPFEEIKNSGFVTKLKWSLKTLEGYLNTWSAVQKFIKQQKRNPVTQLINDIKKEVNENMEFEVLFPVFMRVGLIKK